MNPIPPSLDDEALSEILDGTATDELRGRVDADPSALRRLDALRSARDLTATPVTPLDPIDMASLVQLALASDEGEDGLPLQHGEGLSSPRVVPIKGGTGAGVPGWLVAAVVVVLVGIGLSLVYSGRDDGADFATVGSQLTAEGSGDAATGLQSSARDSAAEPAPEAETSAGAGVAAESPALTTTAPGPAEGAAPTLVELGEFDDADALRIHLKDAFPEAGSDQAASEVDLDSAFRCLGKVDGMFNTGSDPLHVGLATIAGERSVVYELPYRADDGRDTTLVVAVGERTCIPTLSFQR
ncbi:MAG: hypothetical protein H6519_02165 [Microthrixaceae bacterium]|nr:hypothetical protein [Acidimicrobiales bacterium]MCB9403220.1 hypothetical protein [Microthrixaceae bacterium]